METGRFTALGVGTLYAILRGAHLVIRECRNWFGRFGQSKELDKEEFERRKADVIGVYGCLPEREITICVDVKRVYHRQEDGTCWQHEEVPTHKRGRYSKSGTRTDIVGALAPRQADLALECVPCANGTAIARFLACVVKGLGERGWRLIHVVMDNASVNGAALKQEVLAPWLSCIQVHWTPTHAPWLNLAEPMWSAFQRAVIQGSTLKSHAEVAEVTERYEAYWRAHPREYHWPKQTGRKRGPAIPTWQRLLLIPSNS